MNGEEQAEEECGWAEHGFSSGGQVRTCAWSWVSMWSGIVIVCVSGAARDRDHALDRSNDFNASSGGGPPIVDLWDRVSFPWRQK